MTTPERGVDQLVWWWCVAYTAAAPTSMRERRRGEIRSHLWEARRAGESRGRTLVAALAGTGNDVGWALGSGLPRMVRSFATPTPYVALAPAFPVQAWIVSSFATGRVAHLSEGFGAIGGGAMLAVAGLLWLLGRARHGPHS